MRAEFEEKTFEVAFNAELGGCTCKRCTICRGSSLQDGVYLWSPGQVLEGVLGFDVAAAIKGNPDWLSVMFPQGLPRGADWLPKRNGGQPPAAWQGSAPRVASLFLQYKRSEYLTRGNSKEWELFGHPYWRFPIQPHQHRLLVGLDAGVQHGALVAYVAPRFHEAVDLYRHSQTREIIQNSVVIRPGDRSDHETCCYDCNRQKFCSEPVNAQTYDLWNLSNLLWPEWGMVDSVSPEPVAVSDVLRAHLSTLGRSASRALALQTRDDEPDVERAGLGGLSDWPEEAGLRRDIESVMAFVTESCSTWLIATPFDLAAAPPGLDKADGRRLGP